MRISLREHYLFLTSLAIIACIYSLLKPGISAPIFPSSQLRPPLKAINKASLLSITESDLKKDDSDRKLSKLYRYSYNDGSEILALMVRVRKRDDFKIEGYGLLTKGIEPIYMKHSIQTQNSPRSQIGRLHKRNGVQTCIIPNTLTLDQIDVRLNILVDAVEKLGVQPNDLPTKIIGGEAEREYSCLVLTYIPANSFTDVDQKEVWQPLVQRVQRALRES